MWGQYCDTYAPKAEKEHVEPLGVKKYEGLKADILIRRLLTLEDQLSDLRADRHSLEAEIAVVKAENQELKRRLNDRGGEYG